ncbi:MAG TPA: acyltransferase [Chthoniobacteraceae bacterium]|nr:acyltransferase [Chthoniobacteraceae bacterium]
MNPPPDSSDYRRQFRACGVDVEIEPGVWIEHPETWVVGDRVRLRRGMTVQGRLREVTIGSNVSLYPNLFIQGTGTLRIGNHVTLYPNNYLSVGGEEGLITIGSHSHFAPGCALYGASRLEVGEYCAIAAHVVLATIGHDPRTAGLLARSSAGRAIVLEKDVWIGANATVLPGVRIATGCIIGAGAVVTCDTEPHGIYLGVPCRRKATRNAPTTLEI